MVAEGYQLDIYCDDPRCFRSPLGRECGQYAGPSRKACWDQAQREGWMAFRGRHHVRGTAWTFHYCGRHASDPQPAVDDLGDAL